MSDVLFPDLRIGYDLTRKPMFNTKIMTSVNGRELRASYQAVPKYEFSLTLPGLQERKGELQAIEDFFVAIAVPLIRSCSKCLGTMSMNAPSMVTAQRLHSNCIKVSCHWEIPKHLKQKIH